MATSNPTRYLWPAVDLETPCTSGPLTVFPIVGGNGHRGDYMLLADAVEQGIAKVSEIHRGGNIPVIQIENRGKLPVLGIQGEEYVGSKQNRTLNISVLAGPGKTRIPVTCVEQGRWDDGAMHFATGAYEHLNLRLMKAEHIRKARKSVGEKIAKFFADQGEVWDEVCGMSARHGVTSPTMAMHEIYDSAKVQSDLEDLVSGIELPEESRGAVVAVGSRITAADLFENNEVFGRMWPRMLGSYALSALGGKKKTPPSMEAVESFIAAPRSLEWSATPSVGLGEDVRWEDANCLATALVWEDRFLHASVFARHAV